MTIPVSSPMPQAVLLDTCAAIWLSAEEALSRAARDAIAESLLSNLGVYVSPFSAWEIGRLVAKNKIQLTMPPDVWFDRLVAKPGIRLAPLSPYILLRSTDLPGQPPNDPADRIVASTARNLGFTVLTRDRLLLDYAGQGHIRAIPC